MKITILTINKNGKIIEVLNDDFSFVENSNNILDLIDMASYSKIFNLMYNLELNKKIKNIPVTVKKTNNDKKIYFFNGYKLIEEGFVLILTTEILDKELVFNNLISFYDLEVILEFNEHLSNDYDEMSRLNNKLINVQREFSRTNFELKNLNIQLKSIIESIQEYLVLVNLQGDIIISNSNYNDFFNKEKNVFRFIKNNNKHLYKKFISQEDKDYIYLNDIKLQAYKDRFFDVKIAPIYDEEGTQKYFVITFDDVTKRMENIRRLRNLKMAFNQSKENIAITNTSYKIIFANESFVAEYGFSTQEDVLNRDIRDLIKKIEKPNKNKLIDRDIFYNKRINGDFFPVEISKSEVEFSSEIISYIYFIKNITEQLDYEEKLILLAKKDQMTGTYSREAGLAYLDDFLSEDKQSEEKLSILFLDINALKNVNDNFGHQQGDELINQVVEIINESTRRNDIVARLGGDEFLIILPNSDHDNAKMIKERIKKDAQEKNEEKDYLVSVSIGIATLNEIDHKNTDKLINLADHRMYEEKKKYYKKTGKNSR
jgi:diguanylate cyclase (GGDEF)-like protein/PAS domain S-box-containing protein